MDIRVFCSLLDNKTNCMEEVNMNWWDLKNAREFKLSCMHHASTTYTSCS